MRTIQNKIRDVQDVTDYVSSVRSDDDKWRRLVLDILTIYRRDLYRQAHAPSIQPDTELYNEIVIARLLSKEMLKELTPRLATVVRPDFVAPRNSAELVIMVLRRMTHDLGLTKLEMNEEQEGRELGE